MQLPLKRKAEDEALPDVLPKQYPSKAKTRKYDDKYLAFGFTCTTVGNEEIPQCVVCLKVLACYSLKPNKLRRHMETNHPGHKDTPVDFFRQTRVNCRAQQSLFTKPASVLANVQLASYKVAYRVARLPNAQWTHCMIHSEALASKQLSPKLNDVMTHVISTENYII
ncbi:Uncharacterized protein FKW44_014055 [Caligus rogercresseyi]|uniref:SCAN domain-containing protein 3 n=1 Tax=Caligus rogercresseyi TaxID=217165 RepID=A0A7T8GZ24_CALRO|nr:Uncharacterized protein FKW44_014055 [Caligus rogercresseyi]